MERKTLIYNVLADIWKLASMEESQKHRSEMTDEDWDKIVEASCNASKKYEKLSPVEREFFQEYLFRFYDLISHEGMVKYFNGDKVIWAEPED